MELEFKLWLEAPAFNPAMRDVRYGYDLRNRPTAGLPTQVGSDVVTGVGNVFRKKMGAAFPQYGTGVGTYFDELSSFMTQDNQFIVIQYVEFKEGDDVKAAVAKALQHIQKKQDVINAAASYKLDLSQPTKIQQQIDGKNNALKVTFRYWVNMRTSQRFRFATGTPTPPSPTTTAPTNPAPA